MAVEATRGLLSDQEIAEHICTHLTYGGRQFRLGEFVAVLDGEVIAAAPDFESVQRALRTREPDRWRGLILQVMPLEPDVIR
jgi:hypothetical protein